jgi:uridine kinase
MPVPALSSACSRLLVDSALASSDLSVLLAELRAARPDLDLLVYGAGDCPGADATLTPHPDDETAALAAAQAAGELDNVLVLSARERVLGWARRAELPVLAPTLGSPLHEQLAASALVLDDVAALLLRARRAREGKPFLVGVNGIDNSGKTEFASRLSDRLDSLGFRVERVSLSEFTAEKRERRAKGYSDAEGLYRKHYAMERLREQLLLPLRQCTELPLQFQFDRHDLDRDRPGDKRRMHLDRDSMVMLEGPFLFQADLFPFFDFRIYLVSDFERSIELALTGLEGRKRDRRHAEFQRRELAAQSLYLKQEAPWRRAHIVLRGVNTTSPTVEQATFVVDQGEQGLAVGD